MAPTFKNSKNVSAKSREKLSRLSPEPALLARIASGDPKDQLHDKTYFRKHFQTLLRILPFKLQKSEKIFRLAISLKEVLLANNIMIYLEIQDEVKTWKLLEWLSDHGKRVFIPVWNKANNEIIPFEIKDLQQFRVSFGELQSTKLSLTQSSLLTDENLGAAFGQQLKQLPALDVIFVPGLTFDVNGNRLGRGGGTYDRFLASQKHAKKIGLAYSVQVVDQLPVAEHDVAMDIIIAEDVVLRS